MTKRIVALAARILVQLILSLTISCHQAHAEQAPHVDQLQWSAPPPANATPPWTVWLKPSSRFQYGPTHWPLAYFDEQAPGFELQFLESSPETRLANINDAITMVTALNGDFLDVRQPDRESEHELRRAAAGGRVNSSLCRAQLKSMLELQHELESINRERRLGNLSRALDERHMRLLHVLESFGRYSSGALLGRKLFEGSVDQCRVTQLLLDWPAREGAVGGSSKLVGERVGMRPCYARWSLAKYLEPGLWARERKKHEPDVDLASLICVPESCHMVAFAENVPLFKALASSQFKLPENLYENNRPDLSGVYCYPDEDSEFYTSRFAQVALCLAIIVAWLGAIAWATWRADGEHSSELQSFIVRSLSARENLRDLVGARQSGGSGQYAATRTPQQVPPTKRTSAKTINLDAMSPVKVACSNLVIILHVFMVFSVTIANNPKQAQHDVTRSPLLMYSMCIEMLVDTYFVMTAILFTYLNLGPIERELEAATRKGPTASSSLLARWSLYARLSVRLFVKRYARLMPAMFVVYVLKRVFYERWPSPYHYDAGLNMYTESGACTRESWLTPLLMLAGWFPLSRQCLPMTWSVCVDLLSCAILAPFVVMLVRRPLTACALLVLLALGSNYAMSREIDQLDALTRVETFDGRLNMIAPFLNDAGHLVTSASLRFCSFAVGAIGGYILYMYGRRHTTGDDKQASAPAATPPAPFEPGWLNKLFIWGTAIGMSLIPIVSTYLPLYRDSSSAFVEFPIHRLVIEWFTSWLRSPYALGNVIIILHLVTDWSSSGLMRLLSGRFFVALTKLNYAILLIHYDVAIFTITPVFQAVGYSNRLILQFYLVVYVITLLLAVPFYVLVESPLDKLLKALIQGRLPAARAPRKAPLPARETALSESGERRPCQWEALRADMDASDATDETKPRAS